MTSKTAEFTDKLQKLAVRTTDRILEDVERRWGISLDDLFEMGLLHYYTHDDFEPHIGTSWRWSIEDAAERAESDAADRERRLKEASPHGPRRSRSRSRSRTRSRRR